MHQISMGGSHNFGHTFSMNSVRGGHSMYGGGPSGGNFFGDFSIDDGINNPQSGISLDDGLTYIELTVGDY